MTDPQTAYNAAHDNEKRNRAFARKASAAFTTLTLDGYTYEEDATHWTRPTRVQDQASKVLIERVKERILKAFMVAADQRFLSDENIFLIGAALCNALDDFAEASK